MEKIDNYTYEFISEWPDKDHVHPWGETKDKIKPGIIYLYNKENAEWAWFRCPCGCGTIIVLRIENPKQSFPSWILTVNNNLVTFSPSIQQLNGCKSHFFIREGKVIWC